MGSNTAFKGNLMLLTKKTVFEIDQTYLGFQHQEYSKNGDVWMRIMAMKNQRD